MEERGGPGNWGLQESKQFLKKLDLQLSTQTIFEKATPTEFLFKHLLRNVRVYDVSCWVTDEETR